MIAGCGLALAALAGAAAAQTASKPSLMVMPSEFYMVNAGMCTKITIDGKPRDTCDYKKLFATDPVISSIVVAVSNAFQERGFPTQKLEQVLKNIEMDAAQDIGSSKKIQKTMADQLLERAKADIEIEVKLSLVTQMGQPRVILSLDATDIYTAEPVASKEMASQPSATKTPQELAAAVVVAMMPEIEGKIMTHFQQARDEGRRVRLRVQILAAAGLDDGVNSDIKVNGEEMTLRAYITKWAKKFAVAGQYQAGSRSDNVVNFTTFNVPFGDDPQDYLETMIKQFNKDTGLGAKAGTGGGLGDLLVTVDKKKPAKTDQN
jgi:hypothetical protein